MSMARPVPHLQLVPTTREEARPPRWFCSRCGEAPELDGPPPPFARTCGACGLGLVVEASAALAPAPGDAFLIVDSSLSVQALSPAAEELLAVDERDAAGRPLTELVVCADVEAGGGALAHAIAEAAGHDEPQRLTVRPAREFGVRVPLRIGICGPPRAALLVLA